MLYQLSYDRHVLAVVAKLEAVSQGVYQKRRLSVFGATTAMFCFFASAAMPQMQKSPYVRARKESVCA